MSGGFQAFRVFEENGQVTGRVVDATLEELGVGGIVIKASHSSVNYKDALAITGNLNLAATNDAVLTISDLTPASITSGSFAFITYTGAWNGGLFTYNGSAVADDSLVTVGSNQFTLDYNYNGNSVALLAVPEPNAFASLGAGFGVLLGLQRRRSRARGMKSSSNLRS